MRWKWIVVVTMLFSLLLTLPSAAQQTVVTYWTFAPRLTEQLIEKFHDLYPDIRVEVVPMEFQDLHEKLIVALAAGGAPDLAMVEIQEIGRMVNEAGPVLQDFLAAPFNAGQYEKDFVPYKWRQGLHNGRLVAFPWDIGPAGLFYRRSIFEERGFDSRPEAMYESLMTWDDFIEAGRKVYLDRDGDGVPEQFIIGDAREVSKFAIEQVGIPIIDEENVVHLDDPRIIEAVQIGRTIRELDLDGIARINYKWSDQWYSSFPSSQAATELAGSWFHGTLAEVAPETAGDWGVIPVPGGPYQVNQGGSFMVMPATSRNKEAAWKLLEFLLINEESQLHYTNEHGTFSAYMPVWDDPSLDQPVDFFAGQPVARMFLRIAEAIPPVYVHPLQKEIANLLNDTEQNGWRGYVSKVYFGDMPANTAFAEAARELRAIVADWLAQRR